MPPSSQLHVADLYPRLSGALPDTAEAPANTKRNMQRVFNFAHGEGIERSTLPREPGRREKDLHEPRCPKHNQIDCGFRLNRGVPFLRPKERSLAEEIPGCQPLHGDHALLVDDDRHRTDHYDVHRSRDRPLVAYPFVLWEDLQLHRLHERRYELRAATLEEWDRHKNRMANVVHDIGTDGWVHLLHDELKILARSSCPSTFLIHVQARSELVRQTLLYDKHIDGVPPLAEGDGSSIQI
eukprot:40837-Prymnesium_polylepis.1